MEIAFVVFGYVATGLAFIATVAIQEMAYGKRPSEEEAKDLDVSSMVGIGVVLWPLLLVLCAVDYIRKHEAKK